MCIYLNYIQLSIIHAAGTKGVVIRRQPFFHWIQNSRHGNWFCQWNIFKWNQELYWVNNTQRKVLICVWRLMPRVFLWCNTRPLSESNYEGRTLFISSRKVIIWSSDCQTGPIREAVPFVVFLSSSSLLQRLSFDTRFPWSIPTFLSAVDLFLKAVIGFCYFIFSLNPHHLLLYFLIILLKSGVLQTSLFLWCPREYPWNCVLTLRILFSSKSPLSLA